MAQLQELLVDDLRDIYDAEKQAVKAYPKLIKAASSPELKQAFTEHMEMTKGQVARVEQIFEIMGERAKSKPCRAMKGLVEEANEHIAEHERGNELDCVLVGAAQKVEHYEIASYGTARAMAKSIGNKEVMNLLNETLEEEKKTDVLLSKIGIQCQKEMLREEGESEEGADEQMDEYSSKASARGSAVSKKKVGAQRQGSPSGSERRASGGKEGGGASAKSASSARGRSGGNGRGGSKSSSNTTTDHEEIRRFAEDRGAKPACVRGTGSKGDTGLLRLDFPGYSGGDSLQEISWEEFFEKFDEQGLALLYQETTAGGQKSNFNKLVARDSATKGARSR